MVERLVHRLWVLMWCCNSLHFSWKAFDKVWTQEVGPTACQVDVRPGSQSSSSSQRFVCQSLGQANHLYINLTLSTKNKKGFPKTVTAKLETQNIKIALCMIFPDWNSSSKNVNQPHAVVVSGEVQQSTKNLWRFAGKQHCSIHTKQLKEMGTYLKKKKRKEKKQLKK